MNLHDLSLSELKTKHGRLLSAAYRVWGEIQKREGVESIEQQIACLTKKQRAFISALWYARGRKMKVIDIENKVWKGKHITSENVRRFVWRMERNIEKHGISLFLDTIKRKNGDVMGYKIKKL